MKLLIILIFYISAIDSAEAQKASKAETEQFISYNLKEVIGKNIDERYVCVENYFNRDFDTYYLKKEVGSSGWLLQKIEYIYWENLEKIEVSENPYCGELLIFFKTKVKGSFDSKVGAILKPDNYDRIFVVFPKEKVASMRDAFLRLSEIAKEKNKDPF